MWDQAEGVISWRTEAIWGDFEGTQLISSWYIFSGLDNIGLSYSGDQKSEVHFIKLRSLCGRSCFFGLSLKLCGVPLSTCLPGLVLFSHLKRASHQLLLLWVLWSATLRWDPLGIHLVSADIWDKVHVWSSLINHICKVIFVKQGNSHSFCWFGYEYHYGTLLGQNPLCIYSNNKISAFRFVLLLCKVQRAERRGLYRWATWVANAMYLARREENNFL